MIARFVHALWLGSGLFLILAAQAAFRAAPNSTVAADVVGAMLGRWHYIALFAPLALLALEWRRARTAVLLVIFAGVLFAAAQAMVDLRIRQIRATSRVPVSEMSRQDPVRRAFGRLHGISMMLLLAQVIAAGAAVLLDSVDRPGVPLAASRRPAEKVAAANPAPVAVRRDVPPAGEERENTKHETPNTN